MVNLCKDYNFSNSDEFYMTLALSAALKYQGLTFPNPAVGCVILDTNQKIISIKAHEKAGSSHAELSAIKDAYITLTNDHTLKKIDDANEIYRFLIKNHNDKFKGFTIFITLEPCNHQGSTPPCSILLSTLGFKRVVIGTLDPNKTAAGGYDHLLSSKIDVKLGVCERECKEIIEPFVKWQETNFIFFKLAQTINGVIDGGTISSLASRKFTHKIRNKIDLIVIGGNTVRVDRPILDSRLVGGRAPDVLIYSKKKDFDKSIALFNVKNRKVFIENSFEKLKDYKYIMIEGGQNMLEATKKITDWYLFFISSNFKKGKEMQLDLSLKKLHIDQCGTDTQVWYKRGAF